MKLGLFVVPSAMMMMANFHPTISKDHSFFLFYFRKIGHMKMVGGEIVG